VYFLSDGRRLDADSLVFENAALRRRLVLIESNAAYARRAAKKKGCSKAALRSHS